LNAKRGYSFVELLAYICILAMIMTMATAPLLSYTRRLAIRAVAARAAFILMDAQGDAQLVSRNRGVKFLRTAAGWRCGIYEDADGDGVRNDDIVSGTDPLVRGPFRLLDDASGIRVGIPAGGIPHPDSGLIMNDASAVSFNASSLCVFDSDDGDCTPGTLFLTDGHFTAGVRCSGDGGRVHILFYDQDQRVWKR
jgi:hypothetical protein